MLRYDRQIKSGLVDLYDIRPGNGAGLFLQPGSPHGAVTTKVSLDTRARTDVSYRKHRKQTSYNNEKSAQRDANTARWLSNAEPKKIRPAADPLPGDAGWPNLISWRWSLPLPTDQFGED